MKGLDTYGAQCQTVWGEKSSKKWSMCLAQFGGPGEEDRERRGAKKMIMCLDRRSRENELERKTRRETGDQCSPELAWRSGMATGWAFGVASGAGEAAKIDEDMGGEKRGRKEPWVCARQTMPFLGGWTRDPIFFSYSSSLVSCRFPWQFGWLLFPASIRTHCIACCLSLGLFSACINWVCCIVCTVIRGGREGRQMSVLGPKTTG